jgi:hypothetical protein
VRSRRQAHEPRTEPLFLGAVAAGAPGGSPGKWDGPKRGRRDDVDMARAGLVRRTVRGCTGAIAAGLVVLVLALVGVQIFASEDAAAAPGPGAAMIGGNAAAAVLAVACQWYADRTRGGRAAAAHLAVVAVVAAALWFSWWR